MTTAELADRDQLTGVLAALNVDPSHLLDVTLDLVADISVSELTDAQLAGGVVKLRRRMDRADALFAEWTHAAHQRGACTVDSYKSTKSWLKWKTGMHPGHVQRAIDTASVTELLPDIGAGWRDGTISSAAVETIAAARVASHDEKLQALEAEFLDLAQRGDHPSLHRSAAYFKAHAQADGTAPAEPDGLRLTKVLDNRAKLTGEIDGLAAETITTALNAFMDPPNEGDGRTDAQRRAGALVRISEIALAHGACGTRAGANVTITVDWKTLTSGVPGKLDGHYSGLLPRADIEALLCDSKITRVIMGPDSTPLDVGRTTRTWSAAQRAAITARDDGCEWPGCEIPPAWCDIHHHQHWQHGGKTCIENGCMLCNHHHHFLHRHPDWITTFENQVLRVYRPDGTELHPNPWLN